MAGPSKEESRDTTAVAGEKHKTEHDNSNSKRQKTEKQSTLEEVLGVADERKHKNDGGETDNRNSGKAHDAKDASASKNSSAVKPAAESDVPSSILEKGIIYFFIRGRVGIEDPSGVGDIARTYFLLRPIEKDAKLGKGPIGDAGNTRIIALPKKVFPRSGKDRFMTFVDKSGASYDEIKKEFLSSSDYETKTAGTRHTPAATPVGEGVYALTSTGRESHLVYMLTLPEKRDEVQDKLGLKDKGSFIVSTKNPKYDGPSYAQLPEPPMYPKEIIDEFRSLRWLPSKAEHFNYVNSQILLVGESSGIEKATEVQEEDRKDEKADPEDVLNQLEEEDLKRMKDLPGGQSASIFADLEANAEEYPKLQTTF